MFKKLFLTIIGLLFIGTLGLLSWEALKLYENGPAVPELIDPGENTTSGKEFKLLWMTGTTDPKATAFIVQEGTNINFSGDVKEYGPFTTNTTKQIAPALPATTTYLYRVKAGCKSKWTNDHVWSDWSNHVSITIKHIKPPKLVIKGKRTVAYSGQKYTLSWTRAAGAVNYTIQESTDKTFNDPKKISWSKNTSRTSIVPPARTIKNNTTYYYRILANNKQVPITHWSNTVSIKIKPRSSGSSVKEKKPVQTPEKQEEVTEKTVAQPIETPEPIVKTQKTAPTITGRWVAQQVFDRDRGDNSSSEATMILVSKTNKKVRTFFHLRRFEKDLENQLIRFTSPADIDGTGFLLIEHSGSDTEQLLYLPALRRSRRIASSQKSHRFVNSDFTYEDMERHPVDNYWHDLKGDKTFANQACYVLESSPKKGIQSQYSKISSLVIKSSFVPVFTKYYDHEGRHIKTYEVSKLELKQGIWTESVAVMKDLDRDHVTYIKLNKIKYNTDVSAHQVSRSALENF